MTEDNRRSETLGVVEQEAGFHSSLGSVGKSDKAGDIIAISYVNGMALRLLPFVARIAFLIPLLILPFYRRPLQSILWDIPYVAPENYTALREWEAFTLTSWAIGLLIYVVYFLFTLFLKNGLNRGVPGAVIHHTRFGKIVYSIEPGESEFIIDPRVQPYAVVSTRIMTMKMPTVENNTSDNITLYFNGTLVLRVDDTLKLLQAGGLKNFRRQLVELHATLLRDEIQRTQAAGFNRFYIEPVPIESKIDHNRLGQLSTNADLTVEMLEDAAEIDEIDVSKLDLTESQNPVRRKILPAIQKLADNYGVRVLDHVPGGNMTGEDFLHTQALPMQTNIQRLTQATDALESIRESEIKQDVQNHVASREVLVLEIDRIIQSMMSVTETLESGDNLDNLTSARVTTMENTSSAILTRHMTKIESLIAQIEANGVNLAGISRLVTEMDAVLNEIEAAIKTSLPEVRSAVIEGLRSDDIVPNVDIVDALFDKPKLKEALLKLEAETGEDTTSAQLVENATKALEGTKVDDIMAEIEKALEAVSTTTGSSVRYTPESVNAEIDALEEAARKAAEESAVRTAQVATQTAATLSAAS